jgi:hypothetical protein
MITRKTTLFFYDIEFNDAKTSKARKRKMIKANKNKTLVPEEKGKTPRETSGIN